MKFKQVRRVEKTRQICCVYCIRTTFSDRIYIGSTNDFERRAQEHVKNLKKGTHHNFKLQRAYDKHGIEKFEFVVCQIFDNITDAVAHESRLINFYKLRHLYNLTYGTPNQKKLRPVYFYTRSSVIKFNDVTQASKAIGISSNNIRRDIRNISFCCGGIVSYNKNTTLDCLVKKRHEKKPYKVFSFNDFGQMVGMYRTLKEAASVASCSACSISVCMKSGSRSKTAAGLYWSKKPEIILNRDSRQKPIYQILGRCRVYWKSATLAARSVGVPKQRISEALRNKKGKAGGFQWVYVET